MKFEILQIPTFENWRSWRVAASCLLSSMTSSSCSRASKSGVVAFWSTVLGREDVSPSLEKFQIQIKNIN